MNYLPFVNPSALTALSALNAAGYDAAVVGGCVRDLIMGKTPHDWDVTTSATPDEALKVFSSYRCIETGIDYGTITVLIDGVSIEITTFRRDFDYTAGRRPKLVSYSKLLTDDLSRRDFTVNALCLNRQGAFIDLFNGLEDLNLKIIRAIGDADLRFNEDALRILRAIRFSACLGFTIEPKTAESMLKNKERLSLLSAERIRSELCKIITAPHCERVLADWEELITYIIPELRLDCLRYGTAVRLAAAAPADEILRFALLFGGLGNDGSESAEIAGSVLKRLKFSNKAKDHITKLIPLLSLPIPQDRLETRRLVAEHGEKTAEELLQLWQVIYSHSDKPICEALARYEKLLKETSCEPSLYGVSSLNINGHDLITFGVSDGKLIGSILNRLHEEVIDEKLDNLPSSLLTRAKELLYENNR